MKKALVLAFWGACTLAHGQDLLVGGLRVRIGADRNVVMTEARARYNLVQASGGDEMYVLYDKASSDLRSPPRLHGSVVFANGKLIAAQRNWGQFDGLKEPTVIGAAFFAAVESAAGDRGDVAQVSTKQYRVPGLEYKVVNTEFTGRRVVMTTVTGDAAQGGMTVSVDEHIFVPKK